MEEILKQFAEAISPSLTQLVVALVGLLFAYLTALIREKWSTEKATLSIGRQKLLEIIVAKAVLATEQVYKNLKEAGETKRGYAFGVADAALREYGFVINSQIIYDEIEAQVYSAFSDAE